MEIIKSYSRQYESEWTRKVETYNISLAKIGNKYATIEVDTEPDIEYGENGRNYLYDTLEVAEKRYKGKIEYFEETREILYTEEEFKQRTGWDF